MNYDVNLVYLVHWSHENDYRETSLDLIEILYDKLFQYQFPILILILIWGARYRNFFVHRLYVTDYLNLNVTSHRMKNRKIILGYTIICV